VRKKYGCFVVDSKTNLMTSSKDSSNNLFNLTRDK